MKLNSKIFLFLLALIFATSTSFSQDSTQAETGKLKQEIKKFVKEFTDIKRFDESVQVRHQARVKQIKDQDKEENQFPIQLTVYTKLNVDELWAKWLTGKWTYTAEGKKDTATKLNGAVIDLSFTFDTLPGRKFEVETKVELNDTCKLFLIEELTNPISPSDLKEGLKEFIDGLIAKELEKPNKADLDYVIAEVFDYLRRQGINAGADPNLVRILFEEDPKKEKTTPYLGFDEYQRYYGEYEKLYLNKNPYHVPWQVLKVNEPNKVFAFAENNQDINSKIRFEFNNNTISQEGPDFLRGKYYNIIATQREKTIPLYAYAPQVTEEGDTIEAEVGRINLVAYQEEEYDVVVVPVNIPPTVTQEEIQEKLNLVYGQAAVKWNVKLNKDDIFKIDEKDYLYGMDYVESGLLASYPEKCRTFNDAYKKYAQDKNTFQKDVYYIFLIEGAASARDGFMPFKGQMGYVFVDNLDRDKEKILHTIAHELGHGAFRLRHTFDEYGVNKASTNNLMDYNGKTHLSKYQWDFIHNPEAMISWLQGDDEAGSSNFDDNKNILSIRLEDRGKKKASNFVKGPGNEYNKYGIRDGDKGITIRFDLDNNLLYKRLEKFHKKDSTLSKNKNDYDALFLISRKNNDEILAYSNNSLSSKYEVNSDLITYPTSFNPDNSEEISYDNFNEYNFGLSIVESKYIKNYEIKWQYIDNINKDIYKGFGDRVISTKYIDLIPDIPQIGFGLKYRKFIDDRPNIRHGNISGPNILTMLKYYNKGTDKPGYDEYLNYIKPTPVDPIDYMNKYMVDANSWTLFGKKVPFSINVYLYYMLKLGEKDIKINKNDYIDISNSVRFTNAPTSRHNHCLGFAIDLCPTRNPMFEQKGLYYLVWIYTNKNLYKYTLKGDNAINYMKQVHLDLERICDTIASNLHI